MISKIKRWLSKTDVECILIVESPTGYRVEKGIIAQNCNNDIRIDYEYKGIMQSFVASYSDYIGIAYGKPIYCHSVGDLFVNRKDSKVSSENYNNLVNSDFVNKCIRSVKEISEPTQFDIKTILIVAGVGLLLIVLWQSGFLQNVLNELLPNAGVK